MENGLRDRNVRGRRRRILRDPSECGEPTIQTGKEHRTGSRNAERKRGKDGVAGTGQVREAGRGPSLQFGQGRGDWGGCSRHPRPGSLARKRGEPPSLRQEGGGWVLG